MEQYNEETHFVMSRKLITFHKICKYLAETIGLVILLAITALVVLWATLQVLLMIKAIF